MNISQAKEEIKNTYLMYHTRDRSGMYAWPQVRQRPILLIGPPGIGKTAVMEQIAAETGCGLVAYTMTHHTRQSAVGLPKIVTERYGDREIETTRYTMSEIIASLYEYMRRTGKEEGILFIDEINCVSETLTPVMLELLQNKRFGTHRVPEGWMIVAAGNPPEYNRSVRPMDIVTLDRVRRIDVEADLDSWLSYAVDHEVHGAVTAFLGLKKECFYLAENAEDGRHFVTARGWEDLSWMLKGYEQMGVEITEGQVQEFLEDPATAQAFTAFYRIRRKYGQDFGIEAIFDGTTAAMYDSENEALHDTKRTGMHDTQNAWDEIGRGGTFEERFMVAALMGDICVSRIIEFEKAEEIRRSLAAKILEFGGRGELDAYIESRENALKIKVENDLVSEAQERLERTVFARLRSLGTQMRMEHIHKAEDMKRFLDRTMTMEQQDASQAAEVLTSSVERILQRAKRVFGSEQETLLLVSLIRRCEAAAKFMAHHPSEVYNELEKELLGE